MKWNDITSENWLYSMSHLHPFSMTATVAGKPLQLHITFGFHVFTDDKGSGCVLNNLGEMRYFCVQRYNSSFQAVDFVRTRMVDGHTRVFYAKGGNQQFFTMDIHDFALFMSIQKPQGTTDELKCRVISAYPVDQWGRWGLPSRAPLFRMSYVLDMRNQGVPIAPKSGKKPNTPKAKRP